MFKTPCRKMREVTDAAKPVVNKEDIDRSRAFVSDLVRVARDSNGAIVGLLGPDSEPIAKVVTTQADPATGGVGTKSGGVQIGGNAAPSAFTSRALAETDNGMTLICTSARVATVNTGLPTGFGCAFKGAISFAGTATVTDVRTTGAANPWCALVQTGVNTYDAVGGNA